MRVLRHREELLAGRHVAATDPDGGVLQVLGSAREDAPVNQVADVALGDPTIAHDVVGARVIGNDLIEHAGQAGTVELEQKLSHRETIPSLERSRVMETYEGRPRPRAAPRRDTGYGGTVRSALRAAGERMPRALVLLQHLVDGRLAFERPGDRFLHRLVVELVDLLVVLGLPVDEHAHQDAEVVGLLSWR